MNLYKKLSYSIKSLYEAIHCLVRYTKISEETLKEYEKLGWKRPEDIEK